MKINFALVGLAAAQSGDAKDYEYNYPSAEEDRWEFANGVTFTTFNQKTTQNLSSSNFVKALKLSCWNSNMIRDMNNDNKFNLYTFTAGTDLEEKNQVNWNYARGDLQTGMNHQYGFESSAHMFDEFSTTNVSGTGPAPGSPRHLEAVSPRVDDTDYAQRKPGTTNQFHKWGYNTDAVNRAESIGYDANAIQYSFGHADNHDNAANRPYSWDATGSNNQPADFEGYKDDWRYSLRMGGCLYETTNWTYDASSFNKVGRLTYTGDNSFFADIFDNGATTYPSTGSYFADVHWVHVFNAHVFPHRPTGYYTNHAGGAHDSIQATTGVTKNNFSKTQRDIEDFNIVMANPTYEGHGFLNFVATYHDHVDYSQRSAGVVEPYAGYRFWSTIMGYQNYGSFPSTDCTALNTARIDIDSASRPNEARCGSAIYDNFGDWYLRPPQKYAPSGNAQPYWAYIQPDGFSSSDNLWKPHTATDQRDDETTGFRGFAISSFPHNELGQDFRFNIRTLHNMGMGVSKTAQMATNLGVTAGIIDATQAIWSYYLYAVNTIKIAFPEYVARVNHCHYSQHKTHPNCLSGATTPGWQDIIVDGVTMKTYSTPDNDSRYADENSQYGFNKEMGADNHALATLHYTDSDLSTFDSSLTTDSGTFCDGTAYSVTTGIRYDPAQGTQAGVSENGKPLKACASWCHPGAMRGTSSASTDDATRVCGRVLKIDGLLQTYDELHLRQYGTIQEVWVQLMYAYQEGFNEGTVTASSSRGVESPFPNVFFSAPEVVSIHATCPNDNFKCRGYMTDENQPYGGARENFNRVYNNRDSSHTIGAGTVEWHADSVYPANEDTSDNTGK